MTRMPLRVAIAGCGNIAGPYAKTMQAYPQVKFVGATDVLPERAQALTDTYGGRPYGTLDEMLADPEVDLVVNLTIHHAHPAVITQCLEAGKHVHSEKPLAMRYDVAKQLVDLAAARAALELFADYLYGRGAADGLEGNPLGRTWQSACRLL